MSRNNSIEYKLLELYKLEDEIMCNKRTYIYGAGMVGSKVYEYILSKGQEKYIVCFLESNVNSIHKHKSGLNVEDVHNVFIENDDLVILAAKKEIRCELKKECEKLGIKNIKEINCFDDRDYEYYKSISELAYPLELQEWYKNITGRKLNLDNPKSFNEKINWMKIYDKDKRKTILADKYLVRNYVSEKIGDKYLVPLIGVWEKPEEIDFKELPKKFVIKCNHGCGWNIIVTDKNKIDIKQVCRDLEKWLSTNFAYVYGFEMHYRDIKPKIIAEEYIENIKNDLYDYKFWCFNGKVEFIMFLSNRKNALLMNNYSVNWDLLPFTYDYPNSKENIKKPDNLEKMISLAEVLAEDIPFVRVDFYRLNDGSIKFGEMTFSPASGVCRWSDEKINEQLGELIKLKELR